jgi:hypothetical protein
MDILERTLYRLLWYFLVFLAILVLTWNEHRIGRWLHGDKGKRGRR